MAIFKHVVSGPGAAGDVWTSGLHSFGTVDLAGAHAAWTDFVTQLLGSGGFGPLWSTLTHASELLTYQLNSVSGKATALTRSAVSLVGTSTGDSGTPRDCVVLGMRTARPGPSGRGRMYIPGVSETNLVSNGLISTAATNTIATAAAAAVDAMATGGASPIVWRIGDLAGDLITSVTVSSVPGTQRRRSNKIPPSYASGVAAVVVGAAARNGWEQPERD